VPALVPGIVSLLSLGYVWSGAGKMMRMRTQSASNRELVRLNPRDEAKIVIEVSQTRERKILGSLLEKQHETHYRRTPNPVAVTWTSDTKLVMGNAQDIRAGAVVHVSGTVASDGSIQAQQLVILTGYVEVK
jgi:Domain of unknown function (DUF5666)